MSSNYFSRHYAPLRSMSALAFSAMEPRPVSPEDYSKDLAHFRDDPDNGKARLFATCLACGGDGLVRNAEWFDDDECQVPEASDCDTCVGRGWVEIKDRPVTAIDDNMPF